MSNNKKRVHLPLFYPIWIIVYCIVQIPVYLYVIYLGFTDAVWELTLTVTNFDRVIFIIAIVLLVIAVWTAIGSFNIYRKIVKELEEQQNK